MDSFTGGQAAKHFHFDGLRSSSLRFADDVVLLASSCGGLTIHGLIYILTFFCIHELWVVTQKTRSQIQGWLAPPIWVGDSWVPPGEVFWAYPSRRKPWGTCRAHWRDYVSRLAQEQFQQMGYSRWLRKRRSGLLWLSCSDPVPDMWAVMDGWDHYRIRQR